MNTKRLDKFDLGGAILESIMVGIAFLYVLVIIFMSVSKPALLIFLAGIIMVVPVGIFLSLPCVVIAWFYFNSLIHKNILSKWIWILGGVLIALAYVLLLSTYLPSTNFIILVTFLGLPIGGYVGFSVLQKFKSFKEKNEMQALDLVGE